MRRPLTAVALGLLLLGLELATMGVSLTFARLWTGSEAVLRGDEFIVSAPRYVGGVALTLAGTALYLALLRLDLLRPRLAIGDLCPKCGTETRRVRRHLWHRIISWTLNARVTRRHCERCGWSGLAT